MAQLGEELEQGELHKALESRLALQNLGKQLGRDNRWKAIQKQVNSMQGRLRELRGWQHWSNDKIRKRMIEEMEALPSAGLHPDAVLDRIKALQAQWKDLEQSEQIPGDKHFAAAPWMWRKFNAAGRKAFEATKPFLDKRTEIQKRHLEKMRALSAHIQDLADSGEPDWTELGRALARARREMRSLGEIPARARHKMAARLKAALEAGNTVMQSHYDEVEKKKLKLIREAAQLSHATDRDEAISTAKRLQAEWKAAGSLWRSRENQLWREFREPLDPLFENLKAERQSAREERDALLIRHFHGPRQLLPVAFHPNGRRIATAGRKSATPTGACSRSSRNSWAITRDACGTRSADPSRTPATAGAPRQTCCTRRKRRSAPAAWTTSCAPGWRKPGRRWTMPRSSNSNSMKGSRPPLQVNSPGRQRPPKALRAGTAHAIPGGPLVGVPFRRAQAHVCHGRSENAGVGLAGFAIHSGAGVHGFQATHKHGR